MKRELSTEDEGRHREIEKYLGKMGYNGFFFFVFKIDHRANEIEGAYFSSKDFEPLRAGIAEILRTYPKVKMLFAECLGTVLEEERLLRQPLPGQGKA